jgi:hypothetical protein
VSQAEAVFRDENGATLRLTAKPDLLGRILGSDRLHFKVENLDTGESRSVPALRFVSVEGNSQDAMNQESIQFVGQHLNTLGAPDTPLLEVGPEGNRIWTTDSKLIFQTAPPFAPQPVSLKVSAPTNPEALSEITGSESTALSTPKIQYYDPKSLKMVYAQMVPENMTVNTSAGDVSAPARSYLVTDATGHTDVQSLRTFEKVGGQSLPDLTMPAKLPDALEKILATGDNDLPGQTWFHSPMVRKPNFITVEYSEDGQWRVVASPTDHTELTIFPNGLLRAGNAPVYNQDPGAAIGSSRAAAEAATSGDAALQKIIAGSLIRVEAPNLPTAEGWVSGLDPRVTTTLDDGTLVAKYPGSIDIIKPDGTRVFEDLKRPGASTTYKTDGTITWLEPDGSKSIQLLSGDTVDYNPDGQLKFAQRTPGRPSTAWR